MFCLIPQKMTVQLLAMPSYEIQGGLKKRNPPL